jgi:hypothetical protein
MRGILLLHERMLINKGYEMENEMHINPNLLEELLDITKSQPALNPKSCSLKQRAICLLAGARIKGSYKELVYYLEMQKATQGPLTQQYYQLSSIVRLYSWLLSSWGQETVSHLKSQEFMAMYKLELEPFRDRMAKLVVDKPIQIDPEYECQLIGNQIDKVIDKLVEQIKDGSWDFISNIHINTTPASENEEIIDENECHEEIESLTINTEITGNKLSELFNTQMGEIGNIIANVEWSMDDFGAEDMDFDDL